MTHCKHGQWYPLSNGGCWSRHFSVSGVLLLLLLLMRLLLLLLLWPALLRVPILHVNTVLVKMLVLAVAPVALGGIEFVLGSNRYCEPIR